jgi:sugar transport protein
VLVMFLCVGAYVVSLAPVAWLIMSEIFPTRIRGRAMAIDIVRALARVIYRRPDFSLFAFICGEELWHGSRGLLDLRGRLRFRCSLWLLDCSRKANPWKRLEGRGRRFQYLVEAWKINQVSVSQDEEIKLCETTVTGRKCF